ncbi:MAG: thioesterase family protein, partial [Nocardioides sp.]
PVPPPLDVSPISDEPRVPFMHSEAGWSQNFAEHQNGSHKQSWNAAVPIVAGERLTPFQSVAAIADGASLVCNWGSGGVEHINTDITLALARAPHGLEIGLSALDRVEADGIAVGTAAVFDRDGQLGTVMVTSIVNAKRAVDFSQTSYDDDGTRHTGPRIAGE